MTADGTEPHREADSRRDHPTVSPRWVPWGLDRRNTLAILGSVLVGGLAGCLSGPSFPDADVVAGADGAVFEPAELAVQVGDTVTWGFASAGHNVCCRAGDNDRVGVPADAEGFASYGPDESPDGTFIPRGETYEHTFDVPGRYDYVCIPHDDLGMTGTIHVE